MEKFKLISYNKWLEVYKPIISNNNQDSPEGYPQYFYTVQAVENYIKKNNLNFETKNGYHVWTDVQGDDGVCVMLNGWHWCNASEYYITQNPWLEGEDIETYSAGGYECYMEGCHEEMEDLEQSIKRAEANPNDDMSKMNLDYYGYTKEEQEESRQDIRDKIAYCKEEIIRCNDMEKKEFIPREVV